ncbi:LysR family transcriptional regulator, transcriptional activator of the allD operon [Izhakiella capsodis]|uniref:LysR family transcriptional regulator, transcriptional activator of the allD operon n=1 Tax=Izhakiella capsodis TaxID=1367852 RepID=A0A1I4W0K9_9GAMM|nr:HTH-type transcriptional activator AllS [Izhakiella capsodis]SFN07022.1 LysR family transcriptional regulator, transcriptional activator of the allD operon [Izhakiella capsodis]
MLDPEILRTFIVVAETASFSKAADKLCKTTATISYRIKLLEENTGVALLQRTTRSVSLTPAGMHLLEQAREWLSWIDSMPGKLRQINDGVERQVNIVVNNLVYSSAAVTQLLAWLTHRYPVTQFNFSRQIFMGVWDAMLHDDFSLAIGVTGTESLAETIAIAPLGEVEWLFVMAADHPLRQHADPLTESHLRQYPAINVEDSARKLTRRVAWRLSGQKEILVPDLETKIAAHLAGIGIGFLPAALCQPLIAQGVLLSRTIPTMRAPSPLSLAWRKDLSGSAVQEIVRLFHHSRQEIAGFLSPFNAAQYKEAGCCGSIINTV